MIDRAGVARIDKAFLRWQFRLSRGQQLGFLDILLRLVADGIQPSRVCEHISAIGAPQDRVAAETILRGFTEGLSVAEAMSRVFAGDIVSAIGAAEHSGGLAKNGMAVLERLEQQREAKKGVVVQLSWPGFYLLFACCLYAGFAWGVWPRFEEAAQGVMKGYALIANRIGDFIVKWWPAMLAAAFVVPVLVRFWLRNYAGPGREYLDKIWPATLYRDMLGANALDDLGTLMAAGQEPRAAIETVSRNASRYAKMYFDRMQRKLDEGRNISEILDVGLVSERYLAHLRLLAEYRNLRETIAATGASARDTALARLRNMARMLNVLGLAVVALSFTFLLFGVYSTAQEIQAQADQSTFGQ